MARKLAKVKKETVGQIDFFKPVGVTVADVLRIFPGARVVFRRSGRKDRRVKR
jgi:hypothetical protein